jgi:hypothetical protein
LGVSEEFVVNKIEEGTFYDTFGYAFPNSYNCGTGKILIKNIRMTGILFHLMSRKQSLMNQIS